MTPSIDAIAGPAASLIALGLLLVLALGALGIGEALLSRLTTISRAERVVLAIPLGLGAIGLLTLALGLFGLAKPLPLWAGFAVLSAVGWVFAARSRSPKSSVSQPTAHDSGVVGRVCFGILTLAGFLTLVGALAPPTGQEWDSLSYHLAAPKVFLRESRIFYIPYDHHTNFPFLWQMLYLLMLSAKSVAGAKLCHWLCGVLLCASVFLFSRRHLGENGAKIGSVAAAVLGTTPIVLWESTTAYIDLAGALLSWLSFFALVNASATAPTPRNDIHKTTGPPGESVRWLVVSALLMGLALGTKTTLLGLWGACLLGILFWNVATERKWAKETLPHAILWGIVSGALALPWYVKTFLYTKNPVYPFAFGLFGGRYWSAQNAAQYADEQAKFGAGKDLASLILSPWNVTMERGLIDLSHFAATRHLFVFTEYYWFGLVPAYVAALVALPILGRKIPAAVLHALGFAVASGLIWLLTMHQTRYLIPALPALAVVAGFVAVESSRIVRVGFSALCLAGALWGLSLASFATLPTPRLTPTFDGNITLTDSRQRVGIAARAWPVVSGNLSAESYVTAGSDFGDVARACLWINKNTSKTAKVALFDEVRGFYLDREYIWAQPDHAAGLIPYDSYPNADAFADDFLRRGYSVILHYDQGVDDGQRWRELLASAIATGRATLIDQENRVKVYLLIEKTS